MPTTYRGARNNNNNNAIVAHKNTTGVIIELRRFTHHNSTQFDWGSHSPGAHDLALSLLAHHFGEHRLSTKRFYLLLDEDALNCAKHYKAFLDQHIAHWNENVFTLTTAEIDLFLWQQKEKEKETKP